MLSEKPWKLHRSIMALFAVLFCFAVFNLFAAFLLQGKGKAKLDEGSLEYLVLMTLSIHGSILAGTCIALWRFGIGFGEAFGFTNSDRARVFFSGALVGILFQPLSWALQIVSTNVLAYFHLKSLPQDAMVSLQKAQSWDSQVYFIVFSVLIAPMAEEILFRGILYPTIKQLGYPRIALWITAIAFAAIHRNLPIFVPLMVLSLILTWLYERTDNLLASITAHGIFNGITILIVHLAEHWTLQVQ